MASPLGRARCLTAHRTSFRRSCKHARERRRCAAPESGWSGRRWWQRPGCARVTRVTPLRPRPGSGRGRDGGAPEPASPMCAARSKPEVEVAIIGAGVVGLAAAAVLSEQRSVAVIERHDSYGRENSSHNSGVIHAGLYYPPGWLKTTLCIEGNRLLYAWADEHGVRTRRIGKLVLALTDPEIPALRQLAEGAQANGVPGLRMLRKGELQSMEPAVRGAVALYSGSSGVIDQMELMRSFVAAARSNGAHFAFRHTLVRLERRPSWFEVRVRGPDAGEFTLTAASVVNAAGMPADSVGQSLGYHPDGGPNNPPFRQTLNRGCYYDVVNREKAARITNLIYPLPHSDRSGLGIHVTVDVDGG